MCFLAHRPAQLNNPITLHEEHYFPIEALHKHLVEAHRQISSPSELQHVLHSLIGNLAELQLLLSVFRLFKLFMAQQPK
jgi:hypothetical protein